MHKKNKILFILKERNIYSLKQNDINFDIFSSGLYNSAKFVSDMLNSIEIQSIVEVVKDNNCIDRVVTKHRPTHVIIEALWVVPEKFIILKKLHKDVKWIVRIHSEIPFIANEGIAIEWLYKYLKLNILVSSNSKRMYRDLNKINIKNIYLPNYYPINFKNNNNNKIKDKNSFDIGCFGSIRPMKNQLLQAVSSIIFGDLVDKKINFHINGSRVEGKGDSVLKNIRNLFLNNKRHNLIEHNWYSHSDFINCNKNMDLVLQDSFSETFNIVSADAVNNNIPVIGSKEIKWLNPLFKVKDNTSTKKLANKIFIVLYFYRKFYLHYLNKINLWYYNIKSKKSWYIFLCK